MGAREAEPHPLNLTTVYTIALAVFSRNALYKSTFYLLTYLLTYLHWLGALLSQPTGGYGLWVASFYEFLLPASPSLCFLITEMKLCHLLTVHCRLII